MKTLKDYSIPIGSLDTLKNPETVICKSKTLRQSGIDDIKDYRVSQRGTGDPITISKFEHVIDYIKEKFNITEDDLK